MSDSATAIILTPLLAALAALVLLRSLWRSPAMLTGVAAAVSFSAVLLPTSILLWSQGWPIIWGMLSAGFSAVALTAGWLGRMAEQRRELPHTDTDSVI